MRLAQTGHLLTPFVDDAEGRSHDGNHANEAKIQIKRKMPPTYRERFGALPPVLSPATKEWEGRGESGPVLTGYRVG